MLRALGLVAFLGLAAACGSAGNSAPEDGDQSSTGSGAPLNIQPGAGLKVEAVWEQGPAVGVDNSFVLKIELKQGFLVKAITVTPWMTIHNHGSGNVQPVVTPVADSIGTWRVSNVFFVMSGPWDLKITIRSAQAGADDSEETEHRLTVPVTVPAS